MKPIEISAEGFGPFRDRVDLSFEDADFFALIGPTGAGKSSVIDAMCFALYGFVPRYADMRKVEPAITLGALEGKVQFTFEADGERYVATRVVQRMKNGRATTKECRLEHILNGTSDVIAGDPKGADRKVEEVLGLSPEHFTRCVVLPQGEFARFLHDRPSVRQDMLVELLGLGVYGQMAKSARARADDDRTRCEVLRSQLGELSRATEEAEQAADERVQALQELRTDVAAAAPELERAHTEVATAERAVKETEDLLAKLRTVEVPAGLAELAERLDEATRELGSAEAVEEQREAAAQKAEQASEQAPDLSSLRSSLAVRQELDQLLAQLPESEKQAKAARERSFATKRQLVELDEQIAAARARFNDLQVAHAAHTVAGTLVVGQPCPVCAVVVERIPKAAAPAELSEARNQLASLEKQRPRQDADSRKAEQSAATAGAEHARLTARREELTAQVTDDRDSAALTAEIERVRHLHEQAQTLRRQATPARQDVARARAALKDLEQQWASSRDAYTRQRDALTVLGPPPPTESIAADWTALAGWASGQQVEVEARLADRRSVLDRAREAVEAVLSTLVSRCQQAGVGLEPGATYESISAEVVSAEERAKAALKKVRDDRAKAERLTAEIKERTDRAAVASELARLLSAAGFERWVLAEAMNELVAGASKTLEELSQGAYSLVVEDEEFMVVDHREADALRPVKTLSGGETFQASLALALALADHLGQFSVGGAAKLESIFLDEGFGTLDDDSLDVVAGTLETLSGGGRIVGVVTHVKELAERVPVRFQVRRTGRTAVVERVRA